MSTCITCGSAKAAFLSNECNPCMDLRVKRKMPSQVPSGGQEEAVRTAAQAPSEGSTASNIGNALIWLSLVAAVVCIFVYGRVEIPDGIYNTREVWSPLIVLACIASGLNGAFFGYLLSKVGSVLRHLENLQRSA